MLSLWRNYEQRMTSSKSLFVIHIKLGADLISHANEPKQNVEY